MNEIYLELLAKLENAGLNLKPFYFLTDSGSDAAALQTTAVRNGESYILNGSKVNLYYMCIDIFFDFFLFSDFLFEFF